MNIEQIEIEIENEENLKLNYIRLKRIQEQSKELMDSIKGIQQRIRLEASEKRMKTYKDNPESVRLRAAIKECFLNTEDYISFVCRLGLKHDVMPQGFPITGAEYEELKNISGLADKLNHLAQFIK